MVSKSGLEAASARHERLIGRATFQSLEQLVVHDVMGSGARDYGAYWLSLIA